MKKNLLLIIGILSLVIPVKTHALNASVSVSCTNNKLSPGATTTCTISGNSTEEVSTIHAEISVGSNLTLVSTTTSNVWQGDGEGGTIDLYTDSNKSGNFAIATFQVKASDIQTGANTTVSLNNVKFSDASFKEHTISVSPVNIRIASNTNTLSTLSVSGAALSFSPSKTTYDVTVDSASATINAVASDSSASISGIGAKNLNYGVNKFVVTVTAESGSKKDYVVNITRPDNRSTNNYLASLTLSKGTLSFNKNTLNYNVEVDSATTSIKVNATLADNKAVFVNGFGPRTLNLNYGKNVVQIKVLSERQEERVYTITVNRKDDRSSNNNLSSLTISSGTLEFDKNQTNYQVAVETEVEEIEITAKAEDNKSKVVGTGKYPLELGRNEIKISVTAENGSVKEYLIVVIRKDANQVLDTNNYLKELTIEGYNIDFDKDTLQYTITTEEDSLNINALVDSEKSLVSISGNENLKNGSKIKIKVTSEDGEVKTYVINIKKDDVPVETEDSSNTLLYIAIAIFIIGLIALIIALKNMKKKKETATYTDADNNNFNTYENTNNDSIGNVYESANDNNYTDTQANVSANTNAGTETNTNDELL